MSIKTLLKDWTLPVSIAMGVLCYLLFTQVSSLQPVKGSILATFPYLLPSLIFVMLFFTYCKIDPRELKPRRWHLWLILTPQAAIGPGACLLWQNVFNSWQIMSHERKLKHGR